ncbi:MAG: hypothetical protein JRF07_04565 [Deltaproteobacteria bacterium]|jgi:hypothetical protein|nr:hypothetical protein [Deltaproteobacteria bacterium]
MKISDRYREVNRDVSEFLASLANPDDEVLQAERSVRKASDCLKDWVEQVGEIPRMHLEMKLTPILLKAHNHLDRSRLLFEEVGAEDRAAGAWGLQQKIYRLLNDL